MMYDFAKIINLQHIPSEIVAECDHFFQNEKELIEGRSLSMIRTYEWRDKTLVKGTDATSTKANDRFIRLKDGSYIKDTIYNRIEAYPIIVEWFKKNIYPGDVLTYGLQTMLGGILHPHTDGHRGQFVISYMFTDGGNVSTHFWKEGNNSLVRESSIHKLHFDNFELQKTFVFPALSWNLLDARILHSVHNLSSRRTAFSIGLSYEQLTEFLEYTNMEFNYK